MTRSWLFVWSDGRSEVCICRCNKHGEPLPSSIPLGKGGITDTPARSFALSAWLDGGPGILTRLQRLYEEIED